MDWQNVDWQNVGFTVLGVVVYFSITDKLNQLVKTLEGIHKILTYMSERQLGV